MIHEAHTLIRTFTCDEPSCGKKSVLTFVDQVLKEEPSGDNFKHYRTVRTNNGKELGYCSAACEAKAATSGAHEFVEPPKLVVANEAEALAATKAAETLAKLRAK